MRMCIRIYIPPAPQLGQPCPPGWSHADWFLEVLVSRKLEHHELMEAMATKLGSDRTSGSSDRTPRDRSDGSGAGEGGDGSAAAGPLWSALEHENSWAHEMTVLLRRQWRTLRPNLWSNETALMHSVNGVIVGTCWFRTGYEEADLFPRVTAGIIIYLFWTFFPLLSAPVIVDSKEVIPLLRKEYAAGAYRLSTWWWAQTSVPMIQELVTICTCACTPHARMHTHACSRSS